MWLFGVAMLINSNALPVGSDDEQQEGGGRKAHHRSEQKRRSAKGLKLPPPPENVFRISFLLKINNRALLPPPIKSAPNPPNWLLIYHFQQSNRLPGVDAKLSTMMKTGKEDAAAAPALSKKQRGRLKKLRKRIQEVKQGSEVSGLSSFCDVEEWNELQAVSSNNDDTALLTVGPSVRLRKAKQDNEWQKAEGSDQLHILWKMAQHLSEQKKRKRDEKKSIRIPSWCTLHNPCTVQSVAVIELCINDECNWNEIQPHLPILSSLLFDDGQDDDKSKVALAIQTRWFQGNQPKSMTDFLMYMSRNKEPKEDDNACVVSEGEAESGDELLKNVVDRLQELVLTRKDRKKESYPMVVDGANRRNTNRTRDGFKGIYTAIDLLPLKDAKEIVQNCRVGIKEGEILSTFVSTMKQTEEHNNESPRVFALDCEMVRTARGYELARITLLQLTGLEQSVEEVVSYTIVMDEFVKPYESILDYKTEYSGVTVAILNDVSTRLEQIQAAVLSIIDHDDILIGHSLENDLRALCLVHDTVVDTAVVFRAKKERRKYCKSGVVLVFLGARRFAGCSFNFCSDSFVALRHLSATLLNRKIQSNHGADGHCSEEDAAASLNLAVRRARVGESFRIKEPGDDRLHLLESVPDGPVVCVGPSDWLTTHATPFQSSAHALTCETIADPNRKAVVAWLSSEKRRAKLVWARFEGDGPKEKNESMLARSNDLLVSAFHLVKYKLEGSTPGLTVPYLLFFVSD